MHWKGQVSEQIQGKRALLENLAITIGKNPELGFQEFKACSLLSEALEEGGYKVKVGIGGLETSFKGTLGSGSPNLALLCEYDALPQLGHACGHNLIGVASVGAALGLAPVLSELGGKVTVLGTPAEETGGGKALLVKRGVFQNVDAALMFHPAGHNLLMSTTNALVAYEFVFCGKAAHAAGSPEMGINALDAVIHFFNGINAWREHLEEGVSIHGIISEGGEAPNIVPARAVARFYLRAPERHLLDQIVERVFQIAQGAALITGAEVSWHEFEHANDNFVPNQTMAFAFGANLQKLGVRDIREFAEEKSSSDLGNVSQVVPAIQPYLSIGDGLVTHTPEFARASLNRQALETMLLAAEALAHTIVDLLTKPELFRAVQREHKSYE